MEKYIPLSVPNFEGNEQKYVNDAVQQGWVSTGGAYVKGSQGTVKINYEFETESPYSSEIKFELIYKETEEVVPAVFSKESDGVEACLINSANLPGEGVYYVKVSNVYNGSIYSTKTDEFVIDIKD